MPENDQARRARIMHAAQHLRPEDFQPWAEIYPLGCTLSEALTAMVPVGARGMVSSYLARVDVGIEEADAIDRMQAWLWHVLRNQLRQGHLIARGRETGVLQSVALPADLFDDAEPDFINNRITSGAAVIAGLRIYPLPSPLPEGPSVAVAYLPTEASPSPSGSRLDYRRLDEPLVDEMREMIARDKVRHGAPTRAATALVDAGRVEGPGDRASKITRLLGRWAAVMKA
jgi:hypothetical protein